MRCEKCGKENQEGMNFCEACGAPLSKPEYQQPMYQQPVYQQPVYQQPVYQQPGMPQEPKKPVGLAVASMVLGIVALVLSCCVPYLPIVLALLAVVLGAVSLAKKMGGTGMAVAGLVCGIIGLVPAVIVIVSGAALFSALGSL